MKYLMVLRVLKITKIKTHKFIWTLKWFQLSSFYKNVRVFSRIYNSTKVHNLLVSFYFLYYCKYVHTPNNFGVTIFLNLIIFNNVWGLVLIFRCRTVHTNRANKTAQ